VRNECLNREVAVRAPDQKLRTNGVGEVKEMIWARIQSGRMIGTDSVKANEKHDRAVVRVVPFSGILTYTIFQTPGPFRVKITRGQNHARERFDKNGVGSSG
jgi:hypothetical protein